MTLFKEIDVSTWTPLVGEDMGTKPKRWLLDPATEEIWLFKPATFNRRGDGTEYRKGDDWAERVATAVASELGLPVAQTELAVLDQPGWGVGTISRRVVTDDETLVHGLELLDELGIVRISDHDRRGYTLDTVASALQQIDPPTGLEIMPAFSWFVGYLVLDTLIGNTDRHQQNWAVIERGRQRRLAPTFDHASCLGFLLDDMARADRLTTNDQQHTVAAFAARATSKFERRPRLIDVAVTGLRRLTVAERRLWMSRVDALESIEPILDRVPSSRLSAPARDFAATLFAHNRKSLLLQAITTMET